MPKTIPNDFILDVMKKKTSSISYQNQLPIFSLAQNKAASAARFPRTIRTPNRRFRASLAPKSSAHVVARLQNRFLEASSAPAAARHATAFSFVRATVSCKRCSAWGGLLLPGHEGAHGRSQLLLQLQAASPAGRGSGNTIERKRRGRKRLLSCSGRDKNEREAVS